MVWLDLIIGTVDVDDGVLQVVNHCKAIEAAYTKPVGGREDREKMVDERGGRSGWKMVDEKGKREKGGAGGRWWMKKGKRERREEREEDGG